MRFFERLVPAVSVLGLLAGCAAATDDPEPTASEAQFELFVLGTAQDGGLPHLGCARECCVLARESGRELYPASLGVHDTGSGRLLLIEAT